MKKSRYQLPLQKQKSFTLNITSMTDMFTILLVFLLQSFAAGEITVDPVTGLTLPNSASEKNLINGVKLSISPTEIKFENRTIASVSNLEIDPTAYSKNDPSFIKPLFDELQKFNKDNEKLAKTGKVLLQADQNIPYGTLRKIMYTASMAGFPNLKLITTVGN